MASIEFRHTNKQRLLGCSGVFFSLLFVAALIFIISNLGDFLETHAIETFFILLMGAIMAYSFFKRLQGGKELKSNITLTSSSVIVKGEQRYLLEDLTLDEYKSGTYHCFHLYTNDKMFTLYTNQKDDFIKQLLKSDIEKHTFELDDYGFDRNSSTVMIKATSGRMLGFNLDTGDYSIFHTDDAKEDKPLYKPEYFIQTPGYKRK